MNSVDFSYSFKSKSKENSSFFENTHALRTQTFMHVTHLFINLLVENKTQHTDYGFGSQCHLNIIESMNKK